MTSGIHLATIQEKLDLWDGFNFFLKTCQVLLFGPLTLGTSVGLMLSESGLCTIKFVEIPNLHFKFFHFKHLVNIFIN